LNARLVAKIGNWFGPGIANPVFLEPGDMKPVLDWTQELRRQRINCCIKTIVSNATRIARLAQQLGLSLENTTFQIGGEPLTQAKTRVIKESNARIALRYGPGGDSGTSFGCGNALFTDEMHVPLTALCFVENPRILDDVVPPIHPLMLTTMNPAAPRFLFNVENGDYANLMTRDCGCPLQKVGFTQHIHTVRSFEKMTGEGMNYSGYDLFELLESTLPSEFGGGPGDYQLVEEEDEGGQTRLILVVHPAVGDVNESRLLSRLQQGLSAGSRNHRFMTSIWQGAGTLRVRRQAPYASDRGKILPLHIKQKI
jgi:hypothetical protein